MKTGKSAMYQLHELPYIKFSTLMWNSVLPLVEGAVTHLIHQTVRNSIYDSVGHCVLNSIKDMDTLQNNF